jgi:hypothetical protein
MKGLLELREEVEYDSHNHALCFTYISTLNKIDKQIAALDTPTAPESSNPSKDMQDSNNSDEWEEIELRKQADIMRKGDICREYGKKDWIITGLDGLPVSELVNKDIHVFRRVPKKILPSEAENNAEKAIYALRGLRGIAQIIDLADHDHHPGKVCLKCKFEKAINFVENGNDNSTHFIIGGGL